MPDIIFWHADCCYLRGLTGEPFTTRFFLGHNIYTAFHKNIPAGISGWMEILLWISPMKISYRQNPLAG